MTKNSIFSDFFPFLSLQLVPTRSEGEINLYFADGSFIPFVLTPKMTVGAILQHMYDISPAPAQVFLFFSFLFLSCFFSFFFFSFLTFQPSSKTFLSSKLKQNYHSIWQNKTLFLRLLKEMPKEGRNYLRIIAHF